MKHFEMQEAGVVNSDLTDSDSQSRTLMGSTKFVLKEALVDRKEWRKDNHSRIDSSG